MDKSPGVDVTSAALPQHGAASGSLEATAANPNRLASVSSSLTCCHTITEYCMPITSIPEWSKLPYLL